MVFGCQFEYNNILSDAWDLMLCRYGSASDDSADTGLKLESITDELFNFDIDYGAKNDGTLEFEMQVAHINPKRRTFSREEIREISNWLLTSEIHWLKLYDHQLDDYNCLGKFVSISQEKTNGEVFALTLRFKSISSYWYSNVIEKTPNIINDGNNILITYRGDELEQYIYPSMEIHCLANTDVQIVNDRDADDSFVLKNLSGDETITIDGKNRIMKSDAWSYSGIKVFGDDFNKHWVKLYRGDNNLSITGDCRVVFKYREARRIGEF